ncbi:MAG: YciI family protein [Jiangellales bacterium]
MTLPSLDPGTYLVLTYDYVPDILDRRDPVRPAHLEHAQAAKERGDLLNVGAVGSPPTGALFVFADVGPEAVETYAGADPYVTAGLVTARRVDPWTVVV